LAPYGKGGELPYEYNLQRSAKAWVCDEDRLRTCKGSPKRLPLFALL